MHLKLIVIILALGRSHADYIHYSIGFKPSKHFLTLQCWQGGTHAAFIHINQTRQSRTELKRDWRANDRWQLLQLTVWLEAFLRVTVEFLVMFSYEINSSLILLYSPWYSSVWSCSWCLVKHSQVSVFICVSSLKLFISDMLWMNGSTVLSTEG